MASYAAFTLHHSSCPATTSGLRSAVGMRPSIVMLLLNWIIFQAHLLPRFGGGRKNMTAWASRLILVSPATHLFRRSNWVWLSPRSRTRPATFPFGWHPAP